jgi:type I restriction-modification system DNA methylase subunit
MVESELKDKDFSGRIFKICDPWCGAGGMLIAAAQAMRTRGFNYQQGALFFAYDIDARCARMCFIQLSLLGAPAVIVCGNTLTHDVYWKRETIGYHLSGMKYRLECKDVLERAKNIEEIELSPSDIDKKPNSTESMDIAPSPSREYSQKELFDGGRME